MFTIVALHTIHSWIIGESVNLIQWVLLSSKLHVIKCMLNYAQLNLRYLSCVCCLFYTAIVHVCCMQVFSNHEKISNILENMVGVVVSNSVHIGWFCCFCLSMN